MNEELRKRLPTWSGEREFADSFNLLARHLELVARAIPELSQGPGILLSASGGRVVISASSRDGRGGSAVVRTPFEPIEVSTGDDENKAVTITFGIVNNIVPTITGVPLDAEDPPTLVFTESGKFYLKTNWIGDEPKTLDSASVEYTDGEVPVDDHEHGHRLLSTVTILESGAARINIGVRCSLSVERMHCSSGEDSEGTTAYGWAGE